ncbi:MAG TPA: hypothetical protein VI008_07580, partial [Rubrobacter sp.]
PSSFGLGPAKRGIPSAVSKEALLMRENKAQRHSSENRSRCEVYHLFDGASCVEAAKEKVDGVVLCERHALEVKLEGQIECWGEMLFHIDLWSREARRRERPDVVELLQDQREQATSAIERAYEELNMFRRTDTPWRAWVT